MNKTLAVVTLLVLGALIGFLFWALKPSRDMEYKVWPITINELSKTEQFKVVSFHKEVLVAQHRLRSGLFKNAEDKIYIVYPATLHVGFDLSKCNTQSIRRLGDDSVVVTLPPVEVLNKDGLTVDEADKHTAIESGVWSDADMNTFRKRAEALMLRYCEYDSCYRMAEQMGVAMVKAMVQNLGYGYVDVKVTPRKNYGLALVGKNSRGTSSCKFYESGGERFLLVNAPQGGKESRMYYHNGQLTYPQLLALGDFFVQYASSHVGDMEVSLKPTMLSVFFRHDNVTAGSKEAVKVMKKAASRDVEALRRDIGQNIFGGRYPMQIVDLDKNRKTIHSSK